MPGPLDGIRVIDLTAMIAGPLATRVLADQGADVIKVEPPGGGDLVRHMGARRGGVAATFLTANRNKRSVVLDLKSERGRELLGRLVAGADVFVQNFRPGTIERMGLGEEVLRAIRPDLLYVSISGFGEEGPYAGRRVYDPVVQALSGLADVQRDRPSGRPRMMRLILPDKLTAITAAQAITAGLLARARGGEGQHLRLSMLDATVAFLWPEAMASYTFVGREGRGEGERLGQDLVFEARDGFLTAGAVSDAEWEGLTRALERPEWLEDPRFATPAGRVAHAGERIEQMAEVFQERSRDEWLERLQAEDVPCAPVLRRAELLEHPQIQANRLVVEGEDPRAGRIRQPRPAERFDRTPAELRRPAPGLGEHTDAVLGELGLRAREIAALREQGIVA